ncbi:hypothetical protein GCM10009712_41180 [Pseudarthrobacter sulfonivorans]
MLRQYFPKGTDLSVYGPEDLETRRAGTYRTPTQNARLGILQPSVYVIYY